MFVSNNEWGINMILKIVMLGKVLPLLTPTQTLIAYTMKAYGDINIPFDVLNGQLGISDLNGLSQSGTGVSIAYLNDVLLKIVSDLGMTDLTELYRFLGVIEVYFHGDLGSYQMAYYKYLDKNLEFMSNVESSNTDSGDQFVDSEIIKTKFGYLFEVHSSRFQI